MIAFGPVPSRRLGRSLGINNIPPKVCSYSCVYCQLGRSIDMQAERQTFYQPEDILNAVEEKVREARNVNEPIDYLTFVPDGEPTLDINVGRTIDLLKPLDINIAVISNTSLIWREDVRDDLARADWVSLKVDATHERVWRRINRPHRTLKLASLLKGMLEFAKTYTGELVSETMLIKGSNDSEKDIREVAEFLAQLDPAKAYLSIPTRPPAEKWVQPPEEASINQAYQVFCERLRSVELLIRYEGNAFAFTGDDVKEELLGITSVHPMREEALRELLAKAKADWSVVEDLIDQEQLQELRYEGKRYYLRRISTRDHR